MLPAVHAELLKLLRASRLEYILWHWLWGKRMRQLLIAATVCSLGTTTAALGLQEADTEQATSPAATASALPCGKEVADHGEALYPMPRDGKWGYVNRQSEWVIAPQWDQVEEFSEGRAAVGGWQRWGIIDRSGQLVVPMDYKSPSFTTRAERRIFESPFQPFSEGCAAAEIFTSEAEYLFFDRQGGRHYPALPDEKKLAGLGSFSEGLAWFSWNEGIDWYYGWLDSKGDVAIAAEFAAAGDFVGGLAPAESSRGGVGFINPEGQLALPYKWILRSANAFSEGLAAFSVEAFRTQYMDREDSILRHAYDAVTDTEVPMGSGGDFHDDRAPVNLELGEASRSVLAYIDPQGQVAFVPERLSGLMLCLPGRLSEFHQGLLRLMVADDGKDCGEGAFDLDLAAYDKAHYVYLDPAGEVVMRQSK